MDIDPVRPNAVVRHLRELPGRLRRSRRSRRAEIRARLETEPPLEMDGRVEAAPGAGPKAFWIGLVVVVLSLISGLATYLILTGLTPIAPRNDIVLVTLLVNIVLILAMFGVLTVQAVGLWRAWQNKVAGARIHVRIVGLFTVIAALPALLLALAATTSFSRSLDNWFSTRTRVIVANSMEVAQAYLEEHGAVIRTDVANMARDIDDLAGKVKGAPATSPELRNALMTQTSLRELSIAALIDGKGQIVVETAGDTRVQYAPPPPDVMKQAADGQVPLLLPNNTTRVAAVKRLESIPGLYLYGARTVNPKVLAHLGRTQAAVAEFERLRAARGNLKVVHGVMYFMMSMTGILAAIWVGMWFARHMVAPIRRLIAAAQRVTRGDLAVELPLRRGEGDLRRLSKDFNLMTRELARQRHDLVTANEQLTERRRFIEAMLAGVSAGVIGLDGERRIRLVNRSAETLLGRSADDLLGRTLAEAIPEFAEMTAEDPELAIKARGQQQITMTVGNAERSFAARITRERAEGEGEGFVVTFDDISELVSAQRTSAWGDVARRIAHEIKNPLTPIQLSAERLKRKYGAGITADRETFDKLTDTIVRQVGDIKTMVDEFASFARIPKPDMAPNDLNETVQEPVILFRESHPKVSYAMSLPSEPVKTLFDRRLVTQALTNLVKNATESVESAAEAADREPDWAPRVELILRRVEDRVEIEVIDNGLGLPKQNRARLLEPYVTTKGAKGTGLGLAIVQKITEQHGGRLTLEDAPEAPGRKRGALVRMTLPLRATDAPDSTRTGGAAAAAPERKTA